MCYFSARHAFSSLIFIMVLTHFIGKMFSVARSERRRECVVALFLPFEIPWDTEFVPRDTHSVETLFTLIAP